MAEKDKKYPNTTQMLFGGSAQKQLGLAGVPAPLAAEAAKVVKRGQGPKRPAGTMGSADAMERTLKASKKGRPSYGRSQAPAATDGQSQEDWLAAMIGGGGGGGSRRTYSDEQVAASEAKLRALYGRYAQDILDQQGNINTNYATGATNLGSIYDTAVDNVNKSYDAARAEQTRQLLALGMTEQTPTQSFGNQTSDVGSFERLRAAVLAQNEASRNNAITNQRLASEAATREGNQQIAQTVAQMQQAMTNYGGGGGGGLSAKDYATLKLREMEMGQNAEIAAAKLANQGQSTRVDGGAILNNIMKANPSLSLDQAIQVAKIR
jgi:hypothetical protein